MTHLEELREREPKVAALIEDSEEAVRACTDDCSDCRFERNCSN